MSLPLRSSFVYILFYFIEILLLFLAFSTDRSTSSSSSESEAQNSDQGGAHNSKSHPHITFTLKKINPIFIPFLGHLDRFTSNFLTENMLTAPGGT